MVIQDSATGQSDNRSEGCFNEPTFTPINSPVFPLGETHHHYHYENQQFLITVQKQRFGIDWMTKLVDGDIVEKDGKKTVFLRALQKLAQEAGLKESQVSLNNIVSPDGTRLLVQAVYTATFEDGSKWVGCGDAHKNNTCDPFSNYLTAVAESRAEARCLRKALGIQILAAEEIGDAAVDMLAKADPQQVRVITELLSDKKADLFKVVAQALSEDRADRIAGAADLTHREAIKVIEYLNTKTKTKIKGD